MIQDLFLVGLLQGLILSFVAYGVMIPFRLLNFTDITSEGAYPLGGAVCASLIMLKIDPLLSVILASITAGIVGIGTALIHLRLKVNTLLAGIILSTMLYSINLRMMGRPNLALFDQNILFLDSNIIIKILVIFGILALFIIPLTLFLHTEKGLRLRAVGLNPNFAKKQSVSITKYTVLSLFIANCYNGMAGSLIVQIQSYMDIGMGVGIVIHALAALMIGEALIGNNTLNKQLLAPFIGALIYQQIQGIALLIGFAPSDLKFLTGAIVLSVMAIRRKEIHT